MPLRIVFFGTPDFAVPTLDRLLSSAHDVGACVTQPDRPRGRGQRVLPSPVKTRAAGQTEILQPTRLSDPHWLEELRALEPDLGVVAAYGRILPQAVLDVPRLGVINVHASLLPRWRGAAPVHRAILAGDRETGVTIMRVVLALDAGPMLLRRSTPIDPDETSAELEARLADLGARLLTDVVDRLAAGPIRETAQDEHGVEYAPRLDRSEREINWHRPAVAIHNQIRGLHPWPLAAARFQGRRVLLRRSTVAPELALGVEPGVIARVERDALIIGADPGAVRLIEIQLEGRAPVPVGDFLHGRRVTPGERFEPLPTGNTTGS
jgi:methionyl-tRNA formyltransferase